MTYTDEEMHRIRLLKQENTLWKVIAEAVHKNSDAVRQWWSREQKIVGLPPRVKINKKLTSGVLDSKLRG